MNIAPPSPITLLESALIAETTRAGIEVAMLKKAQDIEKTQGSAIVALIEAAAVSPSAAPADPGAGLNEVA